MNWTEDKKRLVRRLLRKLHARQKSARARVITSATLKGLLTQDEWGVVEELFDCDPKQYRFRGPYYSKKELPFSQLVRIPVAVAEGTQYARSRVLKDLLTMIATINREVGERVYVISAYRSPAYQAILFLDVLAQHNFNMRKVCRRVALPGWSEHGAPWNQAVDFALLRTKGQKVRSFGQTKAYRWLKQNAHRYNFHLSYPRDNSYGVMFEPWHWHWKNNN